MTRAIRCQRISVTLRNYIWNATEVGPSGRATIAARPFTQAGGGPGG